MLGKRLSANVPAAELTGLRFGFGLPVAFVLLFPFGADDQFLAAGAGDAWALIGLALVPGLLALLLYYHGLRAAPATAATIAELSFPLTALVVNAIAFGDRLRAPSWPARCCSPRPSRRSASSAAAAPQAIGVRHADRSR